MGTSRSPGELAAKLGRAAALYSRLDNVTVAEAAKVTEATIKAGSPSVLRGVGKKGAKLDVKSNLGAYGDGSKALVYAVGPWQLIERDTKAHQIPRLRQSASFVGVFGHAVIPGGAEGGVHGRGGVRTKVMHPGTKGKHPFAKGVAAAVPLVEKVFETQGVLPLRTVF